MRRPRIVVFDLGGVLVRVSGSWEEAHAHAGLSPDRLPTSPTFWRALPDLVPMFDLGEIDITELATRAAAASGGTYTPDDVQAVHAAISRDEYPGVAGIFDVIEAAGVDTGILSNTNATHWQRLLNLSGGVPEYPSLLRARHPHASFLLRLAKPDPRIFRAFEERSGHGPQEILFFDDRAENVDGARAAGWTAEIVTGERSPVAQILATLRDREVAAP